MTFDNDYDVSVVLALNKIDQYSFDAIDSIINQHDVNHEVILVVNGFFASSISIELMLRYGGYGNVKVLITSIPQLAYSLNLGVSESSSQYIARMDADDISKPDRLSKQLSFLKINNLDMVGSDVYLINSNSKVIGFKKSPKGRAINYHFIKGCPFFHPTVIFSKDLFYKACGYNAGFSSEDFDLWLRFRRLKPKWNNMPDKLLEYRVHSNSSQGSLLAYCEVSGYYLREFLFKPSLVLFIGGFLAIMKVFYARF